MRNIDLKKKLFLFCGAVFLGGSFSSLSKGDIFEFTNKDGFESCLKNTHLVETKSAKSGKQSRYLSKTDVQHRCFLSAESKLKNEKKAQVILGWVKVAQSNSSRENSIHLQGMLVKRSKKFCNEDMVYDNVLKLLSGPSSKDKKSLYVGATNVINTCLKDKQFKQDFLDEQDSTKSSYRYTNICKILKDKKLIKKCFGT